MTGQFGGREHFGRSDGAYGGGRDCLGDVIADEARMVAARSRDWRDWPESWDDRPSRAEAEADERGDD